MNESVRGWVVESGRVCVCAYVCVRMRAYVCVCVHTRV